MNRIDKSCALVAVIFLIITAKAYALNVLADPDFKVCAEQYEQTKRLSEECNALWRIIEQKMTDDIEKKTSEFNCGEFTSPLGIARCQKRAEEYRQCSIRSVVPCDQFRDANELALRRQQTLAELTPVALKKMKSRTLLVGKKVVLDHLKDPDSAKFRNLTTSVDAIFLCGEVNAKNSMGGYMGFKRFFTTGGTVVELEGEGIYPAVFNETWEENCHD